MKLVDYRKELKSLSKEDLQKKVVDFREQLFALRMNAATAHVKDYSKFSLLRRAIARGLTYLGQKK